MKGESDSECGGECSFHTGGGWRRLPGWGSRRGCVNALIVGKRRPKGKPIHGAFRGLATLSHREGGGCSVSEPATQVMPLRNLNGDYSSKSL